LDEERQRWHNRKDSRWSKFLVLCPCHPKWSHIHLCFSTFIWILLHVPIPMDPHGPHHPKCLHARSYFPPSWVFISTFILVDPHDLAF
jgi:hypothetical protein